MDLSQSLAGSVMVYAHGVIRYSRKPHASLLSPPPSFLLFFFAFFVRVGVVRLLHSAISSAILLSLSFSKSEMGQDGIYFDQCIFRRKR